MIHDTLLLPLPQSLSFAPFVWLMRTPLLSNGLIQGLNLFIKGILFHLGLKYPKRLGLDEKKAYLCPFPSWSSRLPILDLVRQIPLTSNNTIISFLQTIESGMKQLQQIPVSIIWAKDDPAFRQYLPPTKTLFPQAEFHLIDNAGHFLQEDAYEKIIPIILNFLSR